VTTYDPPTAALSLGELELIELRRTVQKSKVQLAAKIRHFEINDDGIWGEGWRENTPVNKKRFQELKTEEDQLRELEIDLQAAEEAEKFHATNPTPQSTTGMNISSSSKSKLENSASEKSALEKVPFSPFGVQGGTYRTGSWLNDYLLKKRRNDW
jgi:hypothetical protein